MAVTVPTSIDNLWDPSSTSGTDELEALVYRSNLLASDRSIVNFGGGNTSVKVRLPDHAGRETTVLWVKGSGSDLATIDARGFAGLRLDEILPLVERDAMSDEEMVAYLARCQLEPSMPRPSIETLLHAFVPHPHVDHTHPDAIGSIVGAADGERVARDCFGADAVWIPYIRPGFALSKLVAEAVEAHPEAKLVLLAKHGLVTWGETAAESYAATLEAINRAAAFVEEQGRGTEAFGGPIRPAFPEEARRALLAEVLPALRGAVGIDGPRILHLDASPEVLEFVTGRAAPELSQVGAACPDHLVHTKRRPVFVAFDPHRDDAAALKQRLLDEVAGFQECERSYVERYRAEGDELRDPSPRVILIEGVGLVGIGRTLKAAKLARDLYLRAIAVMRGASALGGFVSLDDEESFGIEYWPLELYKLSLAPPPGEFQGAVVLITGGAGGIGSAAAQEFASAGACVVVTDIDLEGAGRVAADIGEVAVGVHADVTDEGSVTAAYRDAALAFGGVDIVVSNAGIASSAPITETSVELWDRNNDILARGYFLVAREAARMLVEQGTGGSIVFVGSKNALAPGKGAAAYSAAKAAELHLARCLAEELGPHGIRVNTVNPDAVLEGSRIWDSSWREERARAYGIDAGELEAFYRDRTTLKVNVLPADIAAAILFFASPRRSGKSTGNILNVDGGVALAYPR
ncbi:MAG TPA: bifunctional aldolase/short-chain dehydrogenase [Gaiellaceae bacterium]|jgi:rhamnulose-1-phosphate aldolase/alcohol dehydrogenase|nr:bifunctional aldolase/short-chain dehydrogenase [Gaiellaceae bacterium]